MGYDYSPRFLKENEELVGKIIKIAATGEVLTYESEDWDQIKAAQKKVNNVLANMARNMPDYRDIRSSVRCWTSFKSETVYVLSVGIPRHKMAGRPPGMSKQPIEFRTMVPAEQVGNGQIYVHSETIVDQPSYAKFVGKVQLLGSQFSVAKVKVMDLDDEAVRDHLGPVFEPLGFRARAEGDTLILER